MATPGDLRDAILEKCKFYAAQKGLALGRGSITESVFEIVSIAVAHTLADYELNVPARVEPKHYGTDQTKAAKNGDELFYKLTEQAEYGTNINDAFKIFARLVAEFVDARVNPLAEATQMVGNTVAEHNEVIRSLPAPEPLPPTVCKWECYCGWKNENVDKCAVCARRSPVAEKIEKAVSHMQDYHSPAYVEAADHWTSALTGFGPLPKLKAK